METMVLLNVLLMCAWPWEMFFFSLRRGLRAADDAALFWEASAENSCWKVG